MKRKKIVIANWKMNLTVPESSILLKKFEQEITPAKVEVVVCPSMVDVYAAEKALASSGIKVGAQNVHYEDSGAFTGEVSAHQLKGFAEYAIVGHSERRKYFGEGDRVVAKKAAACVRHSIKPIICVGENLHEKLEGLTKLVVAGQTEASLADLTAAEVADSVIAYEPVWAVGTGHVDNPKEAAKVITNIRNLIKVMHGEKVANAVRIVYGGSVNSKNIKAFLTEDLDGYLVGHDSLDHADFAKVVKMVEESVSPDLKKAERTRVAPKSRKKKESGNKNKGSKK